MPNSRSFASYGVSEQGLRMTTRQPQVAAAVGGALLLLLGGAFCLPLFPAPHVHYSHVDYGFPQR